MNDGQDPYGKKALFEVPHTPAPTAEDEDPILGAESPAEGRAALFSVGEHRRGTVVLDCSECEVRTRMSMLEVGLRIMLISMWVPGKQYSRWMHCPECQRRTWCRVHWLG